MDGTRLEKIGGNRYMNFCEIMRQCISWKSDGTALIEGCDLSDYDDCYSTPMTPARLDTSKSMERSIVFKANGNRT